MAAKKRTTGPTLTSLKADAKSAAKRIHEILERDDSPTAEDLGLAVESVVGKALEGLGLDAIQDGITETLARDAGDAARGYAEDALQNSRTYY